MFSSFLIDQEHEQNNACIEKDDGAVVLTDNLSALRRWIVAGPEVARPIKEFQDHKQHRRRQTADTCHHDQTPSVQASFLKDVRFLVDIIEKMGNPFEEESQYVFKLETKKMVHPATVETVMNVKRIGQEQLRLSPDSVCWTEQRQWMTPFIVTSEGVLHLHTNIWRAKVSNRSPPSKMTVNSSYALHWLPDKGWKP